jgi:phosphoribosylformimino-5-aminoimidazole carboxamide ribotide isomerase
LLLIPAIDLKDGRCVRLRQGRMDDETVFADDPVQMAGRWVAAGARRLHLVDLNGAFAGEPVNGAAIRAIAAAHPDLPIQVGGGIRDEATIAAYLEAGVQWCIIGTQAVKEPEFVARACRAFPGQIIVGLDAKEGQVAIKGWAEITDHRVADLARRFQDDGVSAIVYTDIGRDGMMTGPNVAATRALAEAIRIPSHRLRGHHQPGGHSRPLRRGRQRYRSRHHRPGHLRGHPGLRGRPAPGRRLGRRLNQPPFHPGAFVLKPNPKTHRYSP